MDTISIPFKLVSLQPDKRQWKTAMPLLEPVAELIVIVDVPLQHEYIYNAKTIITASMSGNGSPDPQLTPLGLAFVEDALLSRIDTKDEPINENNIEWEEEESK